MRKRLFALARFLADVYAKSQRDEVLLRSSALAFSTLIALVPLLATISIFVARALREDDGRIFELLTGLLPYSEESVVTALKSFIAQAESVSGIAVGGFLITSLLTFLGAQESLFQIFGVEQPPSFARRLATFSLLFIWGPLLVGSAQTGLLVIDQSNPALAGMLRDSVLIALLPGGVTFVGLSMFYWRAAFRRISLRHAAVGAAAAAVALELLKVVFGVYVQQLTEVQRAVYGTFAIVLFFVLSIQLAWAILLYGAEIAALSGARQRGPAAPAAFRHDAWLGLAALERLAAPGRPAEPLAALAATLELPPAELSRHLEPLLSAGLLSRAPGAEEASLRLALPAVRLRVAAALAAYRRERDDGAPSGAPAAAALRTRLGRAAEFELGEMTLADLLDENATLSARPGEPEAVDLDATRPV
jgi:membrane protein